MARPSLVAILAIVLSLGCNGGDEGRSSGRGAADSGGGSGDEDGGGLPSTFAGEPGLLSGITAAHNAVRAATGDGIRSLEWDDDVAASAQSWADNLASRDCVLMHSSGTGYGENIAAFGGNRGTAQRVVDMWVGERECYTYGPFMEGDACSGECFGCGHYTQVVWENSRRLGCGVADCGGGGAIWVCNYDPPGNYLGQVPY